MDLGADVVALAVEHHITAAWTMVLDVAPRRALGLVADEEDVVARVAEHGLEIVHHPAAGAHAAGGDDHGGLAAVGQIVDHVPMVGVVLDGDELVEGKRMAALLQPILGLVVPDLAQAPIAFGEVGGQGFKPLQ